MSGCTIISAQYDLNTLHKNTLILLKWSNPHPVFVRNPVVVRSLFVGAFCSNDFPLSPAPHACYRCWTLRRPPPRAGRRRASARPVPVLCVAGWRCTRPWTPTAAPWGRGGARSGARAGAPPRTVELPHRGGGVQPPGRLVSDDGLRVSPPHCPLPAVVPMFVGSCRRLPLCFWLFFAAFALKSCLF